MPAATDNSDGLEIIKEEQISPSPSTKLHSSKLKLSVRSMERICKCGTAHSPDQTCVGGGGSGTTTRKASIEKLLKEKENQLRAEYDKLLEKKISLARERFNYILQNEQLRACYMLREAHRERHEKIKALESQLECKNLAALMYVMCSERTTSKLEKLRLIEDYTAYIKGLQDLLTEAQELILYLSRGYKTAARVDFEWRDKMKLVVDEFMKFIYNFAGGAQETNQFFLDLPSLMKTEAPIVDDPNEDPCQSEETEENEEASIFEEEEGEKPWWDDLETNDRPFVMFGDMADFKPPQRRQVLNTIKKVKAAKTAPQIWKKYVFNEMTLRRSCENVDDVKDLYPNLKRLSMISEQDSTNLEKNTLGYSKQSVASRRVTMQSLDYRNDMGSLLKIIASASIQTKSTGHTATLLAARDSKEILSTTRLKHMNAKSDIHRSSKEGVFRLEIGKRYSIGDQEDDDVIEEESTKEIKVTDDDQKEDIVPNVLSGLGIAHHDSLEVIPSHKPDKDHIISYERTISLQEKNNTKPFTKPSGRSGKSKARNVLAHWEKFITIIIPVASQVLTSEPWYCPVERCQRMQVDSFMRMLPPYMRDSPFSQFQQTYEEYETCTPEQLELLKQRLEAGKEAEVTVEDSASSLGAWQEGGVGTQTSAESLQPPCTCIDDRLTPVHSNFVFDLRDLIPIKQALDTIKKAFMFDDTIDFNRFKVIGQDRSEVTLREEQRGEKISQKTFYQARKRSITKILHKYPSLCEIFQANTRC